MGRKGEFRPGVDRVRLETYRIPAAGIQRFLATLAGSGVWSTPPNYEDLAGLIRQLAVASDESLNDPLANAFMKLPEFATALEKLMFPSGHRAGGYSLRRKLTMIDDFIGWVIASCVKPRPKLRGYEALCCSILRLREA